jgi:hypothetical protein
MMFVNRRKALFWEYNTVHEDRLYPSRPVDRKDSGRICLCSKVPVVALAYGETMTVTDQNIHWQAHLPPGFF